MFNRKLTYFKNKFLISISKRVFHFQANRLLNGILFFVFAKYVLPNISQTKQHESSNKAAIIHILTLILAENENKQAQHKICTCYRKT